MGLLRTKKGKRLKLGERGRLRDAKISQENSDYRAGSRQKRRQKKIDNKFKVRDAKDTAKTNKKLIKNARKSAERIRKQLGKTDLTPDEINELNAIQTAIPEMQSQLSDAGIPYDENDDVETLHKYNQMNPDIDEGYQYGSEEDDDTNTIYSAIYENGEDEDFETLEFFNKEKVKRTAKSLLNAGIGAYKGYVEGIKNKPASERTESEQKMLDTDAKAKKEIKKGALDYLKTDLNSTLVWVFGAIILFMVVKKYVL